MSSRRVHDQRYGGHKQEAHRDLADSFRNECIDCGNEDIRVLEFDHVLGSRRSHISGLYRESREILLNEIAKCEVRCSNCHTTRHYMEAR